MYWQPVLILIMLNLTFLIQVVFSATLLCLLPFAVRILYKANKWRWRSHSSHKTDTGSAWFFLLECRVNLPFQPCCDVYHSCHIRRNFGRAQKNNHKGLHAGHGQFSCLWSFIHNHSLRLQWSFSLTELKEIRETRSLDQQFVLWPAFSFFHSNPLLC